MSSLLTPGETAQSRTLNFLTHPKLWPQWPFLPLVRRRPGREEELGVVFDALGACDLPGYSTTVFLTNLYLMPRSLDEFLSLPHETYDAPEELCDAGWNVD
jgi:hypothetical protein